VARALPPANALNLRDLLRFYGLDHHELAHGSFVHELDPARDLGKESVVFTPADIEPGFHARAALPHNDGSTGHDLPAKCLESKPLRIRIAAVS
jgi:hypothetical protein